MTFVRQRSKGQRSRSRVIVCTVGLGMRVDRTALGFSRCNCWLPFLLAVKRDVRLPDAAAAATRLPWHRVRAAGDPSAPHIQD